MARTKWFYYLHQEGNVIMAIAKVNSDAFEWRLGEFGFRPCTHAEWLRARKSIEEREGEKLEDPGDGNSDQSLS